MDGSVLTNSMQRVLVTEISQRVMGREIASLKKRFADKAVVLMGYENMQLNEVSVNGKATFDGLLRIGDNHSAGKVSNSFRTVDQLTFLPYDDKLWDMKSLSHARGYIMLQAAPGKTGIRHTLDGSNREKIKMLKASGVKVPVLLGFGISTAEQAAAALVMGADGVVIGSASVIHSLMGEEAIYKFITEVRGAMDAVSK